MLMATSRHWLLVSLPLLPDWPLEAGLRSRPALIGRLTRLPRYPFRPLRLPIARFPRGRRLEHCPPPAPRPSRSALRPSLRPAIPFAGCWLRDRRSPPSQSGPVRLPPASPRSFPFPLPRSAPPDAGFPSPDRLRLLRPYPPPRSAPQARQAARLPAREAASPRLPRSAQSSGAPPR